MSHADADGLKLTTYFGERDRSGDGLLADALLELYGNRRIEASVLLRGIEGFGVKHRLRTDGLLTLSEDLPVVSVAVDTRARIEAVLDDVMALEHRGLITLERARLMSGPAGPPAPPGDPDEEAKLTVYLGRQERIDRRPAFVAICELLHGRGVSGATVLLGVDGTLHGERRRARFFARNAEVPMMLISVGRHDELATLAPELSGLLHRRLLTLERVRVCKRDGRLLARPDELPGTDEHGLPLWQKLMVHSAEDAHVGSRPLHRELVRRLRAKGLSGATSVRGIWGFHGDHAPHGDRLLQVRRHVPVVTIVIDTPERIGAAFDIVDACTTERGLVTSEIVPAAAAWLGEDRQGGLRLARHRP